MSTRKADIAELDQWYQPCGPCAFCGHRDARHRLWDGIMSYGKAGMRAASIAAVYQLRLEHVEAVLRIRPYRRDTKKA